MPGSRRKSRHLGRGTTPRGAGGGFTLTEVLIAISVVALLLALMIPALSGVREQARRVVCGSNQRQIGLAVHMFADHADGMLPPSALLGPGAHPSQKRSEEFRPQDMVLLRLEQREWNPRAQRPWDGLGLLYALDYLPAASVFYCPSHRGIHTLDAYQAQWNGRPGEIVSNYHYRGEGPNGARRLDRIETTAALVTDSLRSIEEINHIGGVNLLQAGLAVSWTPDEEGVITGLLRQAGDSGNAMTATALWKTLDGKSSSGAGVGVGP